MKKKLLFACMLGALTLSSCVDNDESASVTKVRENYIAQKNMLAEAAKIEAESKKLTAEAQANLAAAQAELARAQAELARAQAELARIQAEAQTIANEQAKAEAEQAKAEAELAILKAQQAIEKLKLQYEKEMAELQWQIQKAMITLNTEKATALTSAYTAYTGAITTLNNARTNLLNDQTRLALISDPEYYEKNKTEIIAGYQAKIDLSKAKIESYKKYSTYAEDVEKLNSELELNKIEYSLLLNTEKEADLAHTAATNAVKDTNRKNVTKAYEASAIYMMSNNEIILPQTKAAGDDVTKVKFTDTKMINWMYIPSKNYKEYIQVKFGGEDNDKYTYPTGYSLYTFSTSLNNSIEGAAAGTNLKDVDPTYIKLQVAKDTAAYNSDIAAAEKAIADAEKAIKDNDLQKKYDDAKTAFEKFTSTTADGYAAAKTAYDNAKSDLDTQNNIIEANTKTLEETNKEYAAYMILAEVVVDWNAKVEESETLQKTMTEAIEADYADYAKTKLALDEATDAAQKFYDINVGPLVDMLNWSYSTTVGSDDYYTKPSAKKIAEWIADEESNISFYEGLISAYKTHEQAIAAQQTLVERRQEAVKNAEINYNLCKSNYEAALAAASANAE